MQQHTTVYESPVGPLILTRTDEGLTGLAFAHRYRANGADAGAPNDDADFADVRVQLDEYFAGEREDFDLPLAPHGTPWQLRVWNALLELPYGQTTSYGAIAASLGEPGAARAVGLANGQNPIAIIVPCHRVIGASGSLTGYGGGLERKEQLLRLEGALLA
jgi:methylated-DNA-[protein]-cysteine S-methyltransferase